MVAKVKRRAIETIYNSQKYLIFVEMGNANSQLKGTVMQNM